MKYAVLAAILLLGSCTPVPGKRIDIHLENTTQESIEVEAFALGFTKTVKLSPGERWSGWIPTFVAPKDIRITVRRGR
jgi:hypothetical protein